MGDLDQKIRACLVEEGYLFPVTDAEIEAALAECATSPPEIPAHFDDPLVFLTKYKQKK